MANIKRSIGIKSLIIGGLVLALLIPAMIIQFLIMERENRRQEVLHDITSKWGESQQLTGPVLSVPVRFEQKDQYGNIKRCTRFIYLLPDSLILNGELMPEVRYRGIYQILLYSSDLHITGNFDLDDLKDLDLKEGVIQFEQAILEFGLSDLKGVNQKIQLSWNGKTFDASPGIQNCTTLKKGFNMGSPLEHGRRQYKFAIDIHLNGSEEIRIAPIGKETYTTLSAPWRHPSFSGHFLPRVRDIGQDSFSAEWRILNLNRNFPQFSYGNPIEFDNTYFGVQLFYPVDYYQKTMRTVKYAIMFIGLTFLTFFLIEILNGRWLHPVQYLLIGFGLVIFYVLLLSFSEHLSFPVAYGMSSLALILLISFYSKAILRDTRFTVMIAGVLILLYGFLYINLQLQDYALLLGSIGLFSILSLIMYLTRHIDWYTVLQGTESDGVR